MTKLTEGELKNRHNEENQHLREEIKKKEESLKIYRKEHGKLSAFFKDIESAIEPLTAPPPYKTVKSDMSVVTPVVQVCDSHMGEVQQSGEIEGFNEYNPDICRKRNLGFAKDTIDWINLHRQAYQIDELHVLFLGDLISGDIHDELKVTNEFPSPVQIVKAAEVHAAQLHMWAAHFEKVVVHFLTEDNHARLTRKPQAKEAGLNSHNYVVGHLVKAHVQNIQNIEFNIYPMYTKVVNIQSINYLITHGHGIRAWMGIPWYSIERKVSKEMQARMNIIMEDIEKAKTIGFHKLIHGHFHTPFDSEKAACGGSVSGTSAYDHQAGRHSEPSQAAWMVGSKGEFNRTNFKLKYHD